MRPIHGAIAASLYPRPASSCPEQYVSSRHATSAAKPSYGRCPAPMQRSALTQKAWLGEVASLQRRTPPPRLQSSNDGEPRAWLVLLIHGPRMLSSAVRGWAESPSSMGTQSLSMLFIPASCLTASFRGPGRSQEAVLCREDGYQRSDEQRAQISPA